MAAFTAPSATTKTLSRTVGQAAWLREESSKGASKCWDMEQNTILEKTHEFFQMCDVENKGFINRRDMQVSYNDN